MKNGDIFSWDPAAAAGLGFGMIICCADGTQYTFFGRDVASAALSAILHAPISVPVDCLTKQGMVAVCFDPDDLHAHADRVRAAGECP